MDFYKKKYLLQMTPYKKGDSVEGVSISNEDLLNDSPKKFFEDNYEWYCD